MTAEIESLKEELEREQTARKEAEINLLKQEHALCLLRHQCDHLAKRAHQLGNHDSLTGLVNRQLLLDRLEQAMAYADRYDYSLWVIVLNLDHFQVLNENLGATLADQFLRVTAERLKSILRRTDTIARESGDEFMLILPDSTAGNLSIDTLLRVQDTLAQPVLLGEHRPGCTASFGVAIYPKDAKDPESLMDCAEVALLRAKERGRNHIQFFTPEMGDQLQSRLSLQAELRHAIERSEFVLHYQPQVDLQTGDIVGCEALLRWQHPERGLLLPSQFLDVAEQTGLIIPMGEWVLQTALTQNKTWQKAGLKPIRMAINLSATELMDPHLPERLARVLQETGLPPRFVELDMAEGVVMPDGEGLAERLSQLRALGVSLAVDDFGSAFSSLTFLRRVPINTLKIDPSLVRDMTLKAADATLVRSVISLAHSLGMRVIAEGVETHAKMAYLRRYGCDEMQGFYFSRPVDVREFEDLLRQGKRLTLTPHESPALLLVENAREVDSALYQQLAQTEYVTFLAETASESFDYLAAHSVQVVICESRLPLLSGVDLLRQVRDMYPDTVRMLLVDEGELTTIRSAAEDGVVHRYLSKPWNEALLQQWIREAFQHHATIHGMPNLP